MTTLAPESFITVEPLAYPQDLAAVPVEVRKRVVATLVALRSDPFRGKVLDPAQPWQRFSCSLEGLRSIPVSGGPIRSAAYEEEVRVVYRVLGGDGRLIVRVIAIGPRMGSACYRLAAERLSPPKPRRRVRR